MNTTSAFRFLVPAVLMLGPAIALAADRELGDLATSGSIAMPAAATSVFTNPAALVASSGLKLSLQAGTPDPMDDPTFRGLVMAGNGGVGGAFGLDTWHPDGPRESRTWAVYGVALDIADFALGLGGRTGLKNAEGTELRLGGLFRPNADLTLGATVLDVGDGPDGYGLGLAYDLRSGVSLVGDVAFDRDFGNPELKPGLKLSNGFAGLSVSYGTGRTNQFAEDFTTSLYFRVGADSKLAFDYNHGGELPKYYASLTFGL
jgi:hypothetical protein